MLIRSTERNHNLEFKDLKFEKDRELSSEVFCYVNSEENCNQKLELNQKAANFTSNIAINQPNYEDRAVEFKAKALFELEQIIIEIEQFKQICQ